MQNPWLNYSNRDLILMLPSPDPRGLSSRNSYALFHAVENIMIKGQDYSLLNILLAYGADINTQDIYERRTVAFGINGFVSNQEDSEEVLGRAWALVDHLVENGFDVNRVDCQRTTPLLGACLRQSWASESLCSLYLENDADPYIANTEGQSPASLDDRYSYGTESELSVFQEQFKGLSLFAALVYQFPEPFDIWIQEKEKASYQVF